MHEEEGGQHGCLREVEARPQSVLLYVVVWVGCEGAVHGADGDGEGDPDHGPGGHRHEAVGPAGAVQLGCGERDYAEAEASVQESLVEVLALEGGHAAVFAGLAIEDQVGGEDGAA